MEVLPVTLLDYPQLDDHCAEFWKHSPFTEPYVRGSAETYLDIARSCGLLFKAIQNGRIIGFAAGAVSPLMGDSSILMGSELAWWVEPSSRSTGAGIALLERLEDAARAIGVKYWTMIYMETSMPEQIRQIYEQRGYSLKETSYVKQLY